VGGAITTIQESIKQNQHKDCSDKVGTFKQLFKRKTTPRAANLRNFHY